MTTREAQQREVDDNLSSFLVQLPDLMKTQRDRYALLRHGRIVDFFDTFTDAATAGRGMFADRLYSVQKITNEPIDLGIYSHAVHLG